MRRRCRLDLIVMLSDGSTLLVPAAWTDLEASAAEAKPVEAGTLAGLDDLLAARRVLDPLLERVVLAERDHPRAESSLSALAEAEAKLTLRAQQRPKTLTNQERQQLLALDADLVRVWSAPTTTDRDRKQLLRCLIEEVILNVHREQDQATIAIRWQGGAITELAVPLSRHQPTIRTDEDTLALMRRLAVHYDDGTIAGILNRQHRRSATGQRFTAQIVSSLRNHHKIPRFQPPDGEPLPIAQAAEQLGVAASTIHRWLQAGFIAGEQDTPGAPWRIRVNDQLRTLFVEDAPPGYVPIVDAMRALGVARQTVLQRVKRGELQALHVRNGRRKGLRIMAPKAENTLFDTIPIIEKAV